MHCGYFDTTRKDDHRSFLTPTVVCGRRPFRLKFALKMTHLLRKTYWITVVEHASRGLSAIAELPVSSCIIVILLYIGTETTPPIHPWFRRRLQDVVKTICGKTLNKISSSEASKSLGASNINYRETKVLI